jgi:hypothetical protein
VIKSALFLMLAACGAPRPPCMDASTPLDEKHVPLSVVTEGPKFPMRGPVLSITPLPQGRYKVEVAGGGFADERSVVLATPSGAALPFRTGQILEVKVTPGRHLEIRDARNALLAMMFASDAELEDWSAADRGGGSDCFVAVHHANACAFVPSGTWRRLETPDGAWAVHATCASANEPTTVRVTRLDVIDGRSN